MNAKELQLAREANKQRNRERQLRQLENKIVRAEVSEVQQLDSVQPNVVISDGAIVSRRRRRRNRRRNRQLTLERFVNPQLAQPQMADGLRGNPVDPRTSKTIRQLGQTNLGSNWVIRALHPCGEGINIVPKVPDGALSDSVVFERRDEFDIKMPTGDPFTKGGTWNVMIVSLPLVKTPMVALAYTSAASQKDIEKGWFNIIQNTGDASVPDNVNYDASIQYPSWKTDATNYPNVGMTVLSMANLDKGMDADNMTDVFITIRRTYMGTTMDFDANDLTNKGRLVSGQIACNWAHKSLDIYDTTATDPAKAPVLRTQDCAYMSMIPLTETNLTQQDQKVREAECKEGDYAPNRFWEPVFTNSAAKEAAVINVLDPLVSDTKVVAPRQNMNIPLKGWGYQVSFWLGIQDTSSIRVKRREGLEINTSASSPYSPFSTPAYPRDDRAQMVFREFCREQGHSFPSSYNSAGGMLKSIICNI